jgi:hypothetical protein
LDFAMQPDLYWQPRRCDREPPTPEKAMTIEGKTALVTGSNRGIGQALIEEALRAGAPVPSRRSSARAP